MLAGRREGIGNVAAAVLGVFTPFCSCSAPLGKPLKIKETMQATLCTHPGHRAAARVCPLLKLVW